MYGDEMASYKVHNNVQAVHENKVLVIELFEGSKTDPVLPAKLGSFRIEMNRIDNACPSRGWGAVTEITTQTDSSLEWAEVEIEMRVIDVQPSYYIWKSKQVADQITQQVEQIERFNDDQKQSTNSCNLTANIRGINRISLLHAAVHLNDHDLVKRVLRLGANPLLRSTMGSALAYAQQLRDRANEKTLRDRANEKTSVDDDPDAGRREGNLGARQAVLAHHNKVVEMLRSAAQANESQSPPAGPESVVIASPTSCEQKPDDNDENMHGDIADVDDLYGDAGVEAYVLARSSSKDSGIKAASKSDLGIAEQKVADAKILKAASKPDLGIAEQKVADAKILRDIMRDAPPKAGGVPNGSRCHKGHIGGVLKKSYAKQFPNLVSSRAFLKRVIDSGIVKEVKLGMVSTYYFDSPDPTPHHDQPPLQRDVSDGGNASAGQDGDRTRATSGVSNPGVSYKDLYGDASKPNPETLVIQRSEKQIDDAKILWMIMKDAPDTAGGEDGSQCKKSFVQSQLCSRFANLFPNLYSVRDFMHRAIASGIVKEKGAGGNAKIWHFANSDATGNHSRRPSLTSKSYPQQDVRLPELTETDFAILYADKTRCKKGDRPGQCWHAENGGCHFWHTSQLLGPALIDDESKFVGAQLPILDPLALTLVTRHFNGLDYVTATFIDNNKKMIYFAEGGPLSQLNRKQMTFWYPTREAAAEALQRVLFLVNSTTR
jgi:hypothetical protein